MILITDETWILVYGGKTTVKVVQQTTSLTQLMFL